MGGELKKFFVVHHVLSNSAKVCCVRPELVGPWALGPGAVDFEGLLMDLLLPYRPQQA